MKGTALGETVGLDGRLLHPQVHGVQVDAGMTPSARSHANSAASSQTHGPDSVAFYVSGQLLTEDYYVANKLMKGYIGAANIDTNSRLCMASAVAGYKRAFGEDVVPVSYEDLDVADLVVLVGSNTAWCHPVLLQRLTAAREQRGLKIVAIDPRRTATTRARGPAPADRSPAPTSLCSTACWSGWRNIIISTAASSRRIPPVDSKRWWPRAPAVDRWRRRHVPAASSSRSCSSSTNCSPPLRP